MPRRCDYYGVVLFRRTWLSAAWSTWLAELAQYTIPNLPHLSELRLRTHGRVCVWGGLYFGQRACNRFWEKRAAQDVDETSRTNKNDWTQNKDESYKRTEQA